MPRYSIRKNRIKSGCMEGFVFGQTGSLAVDENSMYHILLLKGIDSTVSGAGWGRFSFGVAGGEDLMYITYAQAIDNTEQAERLNRTLTDPDIAAPEKLSALKKAGAKRFIKANDCLLYDLKGRYLFIALEALGEGNLTISNMVIDSIGDNFMQTFPEVYRERGSFFHRYISIFSSIYNDFQGKIDSLYRILDVDTCSEEQLIIYGDWLGIHLREGLLPIEAMRKLVKEGYELNRMKGTKAAIERVLEIILGEKPVIIEHNQVRKVMKDEESDLPPQFEVRSLYDVTILVKCHLTEELRHQVVFLLDQFKPVRTRISVSQMDERPTSDSNSFLDVNTVLPGSGASVRLDENASLSGVVALR